MQTLQNAFELKKNEKGCMLSTIVKMPFIFVFSYFLCAQSLIFVAWVGSKEDKTGTRTKGETGAKTEQGATAATHQSGE